jgi:nucleotide-binding universal stress UspA family protein
VAAGEVSTIAVGTDGTPTAARAVEFAVGMAERYGARLVVASCYEPVPEDQVTREQRDAPQEIQWAINPQENVDAVLREAEEKGRSHGLDVASEARMGKPAKVLCDIAEDNEADVLVVGSVGMERKIRGSVPNTVAHEAPCSVVIVKTTE